jgi:hypothetical protein
MSFRRLILCAFLFFPTLAFSSITGNYTFKGIDRAGDQYHGTATIVKAKGGVYNARWVYSDGSFEVGTGVEKEGRISFVFASVADHSFGRPGVIAYKIDGHTLKGVYTFFAQTGVGHEKMKKIEKK